jgi:VWFA-related protein
VRSLAALVVASSIAVSAVPSGQGPGQSQPPTFRSATRLVPVSVVVHDGRNRPVDGLKADDFRILEDGREVPIAFFSVRAETQGATSSSLLEMAAQGRFTNRVQSPTGGGVVAIVFDQLNTSDMDQAYGRQRLIGYLRTIRPDDRVALFALTSTGMRILYDFTRDAESLIRALDRLDRGESPAAIGLDQRLPPQLVQGLSAFAQGTLDRMEAHYARLRGTTTLEALEVVSEYLGGIPGRKNVVWISSGFPFSIGEGGPSGMLFSNLRLETQRAARALNHSDTAVYPVDSRGLVAQSTDVNAPGRVPSLAEVMGPLDGVRSIADWTGGRAFFNTNDIGRAITLAVDDSRQTYVLGYYPVNTDWDERFRKIDVKVRRSGVQVRHREGYFALAPEALAGGQRRAAISAAVLSPLEATSIPIDVTITTDAARYSLAMRFDPGAVAFQPNNGRWSGELVVAVAQMLQTREFVRDPDQSLPLLVDAAARERLLVDGVRATHSIDLRPDAQQVRIVVRDVVTGSIGSVFIDAERIRKLQGGSAPVVAATSR